MPEAEAEDRGALGADVLDEPIGPDVTWTRINIGEAFPGVPTPLTWTWAGHGMNAGITRGWVSMGVFPALRGGQVQAVPDRFIAISRGRVLANLDLLRAVGDRIPLNSGDQVERSLFQSEPVSTASRPVRRRYPLVMAKLPVAVIQGRRSLLRTAPTTLAWWRASLDRLTTDPAAAPDLLTESADRFIELVMNQFQISLAGTGAFDTLSRICTRHGLPHAAGTLATTITHNADLDTVHDLWELAHGRMELTDFLRVHGYHAPVQGELAVPSWRVDATPVLSLMRQYGDRPDGEDPQTLQRRRRSERDDAERELLGRIPRLAVLPTRRLIRLVQTLLPLREIARSQYLQCYDVARAAATALGSALRTADSIDTEDDVFYLTFGELRTGNLPPRDVVLERRERRAHYEAHDIPVKFRGEPTMIPITGQDAELPDALTGIPGSAGVAEGIARIIDDPDDSNDLRDGEVLVAETTNPSFAPFFLIAAAVVVEIGGPMSHGAVVAREMGIPCVINARHARRTIRNGDLIRVNGNDGTVEILERRPIRRQ